MSNEISTLINIEDYKNFLKFQGLSESEIDSKIEEIKNRQSLLISQKQNISVENIGNTEDKQATPFFARLKNGLLPLFNKRFSNDNIDGNTVLNKAIVSGVVSKDFLTGEIYKNFLTQSQNLAESFGVELKTSSRSLNDGTFENIFYAKGFPANINKFTQDFKELASVNNLSLTGLSENINFTPKLDEKFIPQNKSLDFSMSEEILENEVDHHDDIVDAEDHVETRKMIQDIYEEKLGFVMPNTSQIDYPSFNDKSNGFKFAQAVKGYKKVAAEISKEMINTQKLKEDILKSYSTKQVDNLLVSLKKVDPSILYTDIIKAIKSDDFYSLPKTPELENFFLNLDKIKSDMAVNEQLLKNNKNRITYLSQALTCMQNLAQKVSDKDVRESKSIDWELSLNLPKSIFNKGFSFITPSRYYKEKLYREIKALKFPYENSFYDVKEKYLTIDTSNSIFTPVEKMIKDEQFNTINSLRNLLNEKVMVIKSDFDEHIKRMNRLNDGDISSEVNEFLVLAKDYENLSLNEEARFKSLKEKFENILIEDELFFEENKENVEQLEDMCRAYSKILTPVNSSLSRKEVRKALQENESMLSGLSEVARKTVVDGPGHFMQENFDELRNHTALLKDRINQAINPVINQRVQDIDLIDELKLVKNDVLSVTKSYPTLMFLNEYTKMENLIKDSFDKAQGINQYAPNNESDPERAKKLDDVFSRMKKVVDNPDKSYDPKYLLQLHDRMEKLMEGKDSGAGLSKDDIIGVEDKIKKHLRKMEWMLIKNPEIKRKINSLGVDFSPTLYSHSNKENMLSSLRHSVKVVDVLKTLKPIDTNGFEEILPAFKERVNFENLRVIEQEKMHTVNYIRPSRNKKKEDMLSDIIENIVEKHDEAVSTMTSTAINESDIDKMFPPLDDLQVGDGSQNSQPQERRLKRNLTSVSKNPRQ